MSLDVRLNEDVKAALKAKDTIRVSTLRMVRAEIATTKLTKNKKGLDDAEIIKIIQGHVKRHKESIAQFEKGGRQDLVDKETRELEILSEYLPEPLSDEELMNIVEETIADLGTTSKKEMGRVMKAVMEKVAGRADGKSVSRIVSSRLS